MKVVKTLALVASTIGFANVGLSLPAHSQQVASNQATQTAIVIGNNNTVNQTNILVIKNRGRFNGNSRFPSTTSTTQAAEIQGNVKSQISELGAIIMHTPGIDTDSTKVTVGRVTIDRNRRRLLLHLHDADRLFHLLPFSASERSIKLRQLRLLIGLVLQPLALRRMTLPQSVSKISNVVVRVALWFNLVKLLTDARLVLKLAPIVIRIIKSQSGFRSI